MTVASPVSTAPPSSVPPRDAVAVAKPAEVQDAVVVTKPAEPVAPISGSAEFLAACQRSVERLVIIQVKAPWCRSCKALEPKVRRLAREFSNDIYVYSMDFEDPENKPIAHQLGVKNMPTFMFFSGAYGLVEQFTCGPSRAAMLREKIDIYIAGECPYSPDADKK